MNIEFLFALFEGQPYCVLTQLLFIRTSIVFIHCWLIVLQQNANLEQVHLSLSLSCSSLSLSFQETTVSAWVPVLWLDGRSAIDHHAEPWSLCLSTEHDTHVGNPKAVWKGQTVDTHYVVPRTSKTHTHTHAYTKHSFLPLRQGLSG